MLAESLKGVVSQTLLKRQSGGRVAAREVLLVNPAVSNLIREGKTVQIPTIMQTNKKLGMVTLNDALMDLVNAGEVDPLEAWLKSVDKSALAERLRAKGIDVAALQRQREAASGAPPR
jgi:twitching motility protein PilT